MLNLIFEQINDRFENLPERLKEAIFSPAIDATIIRLCQSYRLDNEKISAISRNIGEILFGFESYKNLSSDLQADLNIDNKLATAISQDIWSKILSPYNKELEEAYNPTIPPANTTIMAEEIKTSPPPVDLRFLKKEEIMPPPASAQPIVPPPAPTPTPIPAKPATGPAILFKPEASPIPPPTPTRKPSLGGLFGAFSRKETEPTKEKIKVQIETSMPMPKPEEKSKVAKTEVPEFKVVHYTQFEPQIKTSPESPKMIFGAPAPTTAKQTIPPPPATTPPAATSIVKPIPPPIIKPSPSIPKPTPPIIKPVLPVTPKPFEIQKPPIAPMPPISPAKPISPTLPTPAKPLIQPSSTPPVQPKPQTPSTPPIVLKPSTPPSPAKPSIPPIQPTIPTPQKIPAKPIEGEEMIDLMTFEKVKIKPEPENNQLKNNDVIDLRK